MEKRFLQSAWSVTLLEALVLLGGACLARLHNYPLFHGVVELFSVIVAGGIFVIAWNCRGFMDNRYLLFVGIGYLFVGLVDLLHTLAYKGMDVFAGQRPDLSIQLWIVGRSLEALSLLVALLMMKRFWRPGAVLAAYGLATALVLAWVFSGKFPACFIEQGGQGKLTLFKVIGEYIICLVLAATMIVLRQRRAVFDPLVLRLMVGSMALTILGEMAFTVYTNVYGPANMVGHLFKLAAYFLVYKAVIETALRRPASIFFLNLRKSEDALRSANEQLERRTRELEWTNEELEAFAHTVAHDLQNPLTTIRGFSGILERDLETGDLSAVRLYAERITATSERMGRLIKNLLDLARVRHGELRRKPVDLSQIAKDAAEQLRRRDPARAVDFAIEDGLRAEGDPELLQVAIENLLDNAWKFTTSRARARIEVGAAEQDGRRVFFVRDNGVGFDPAHAQEIFQAFKRLPTEEEITGTGIGLASVHRIVERHGGRIWAEGAPGQGATFHFIL